MRFSEFGLSEPILRALDDLNYETATPIQAGTIPLLLKDRDVVGQAQTGTGKTAAFVLPILERIDPEHARPQALVLRPTRELALQVADALAGSRAHLHGVEVLPVYGGAPIREQSSARPRRQVVVGTPGRVLDHLDPRHADPRRLPHGRARRGRRDARDGLHRRRPGDPRGAPRGRQTALFSATMPPRIRTLAQTHLNGP